MECELHHFCSGIQLRQERQNIAFAQPAFTKRLENVLRGLASKKIGKETKKLFFVWEDTRTSLEIGKWSQHSYALQEHWFICHYIESTYSHVETAKSMEELTKGKDSSRDWKNNADKCREGGRLAASL